LNGGGAARELYGLSKSDNLNGQPFFVGVNHGRVFGLIAWL
jgi:hypothetical protein